MPSDFRRDRLKQDLLHVLRVHPNQVYMHNVFNLLEKNTGRKVKASDFGLKKLSNIFDEWPEFRRVKDGKNIRICLKKDYKERQGPSVESYVDDFPLPSTSGLQKGQKKRLDVATWKNIEPVIVSDDDDDDDVDEDEEEENDDHSHDKVEANNELSTIEFQTALKHKIVEILYNNGANSSLTRVQIYDGLMQKHGQLFIGKNFTVGSVAAFLAKMKTWGYVTFGGSKIGLSEGVLMQLQVGVALVDLCLDDGKRPNKTAMELMKSGSSYDDRNHSGNADVQNQPPSADFISLVDDDGADYKKSGKEHGALIDLTEDSPGASRPQTPKSAEPRSDYHPLSMGQTSGPGPVQSQVSFPLLNPQLQQFSRGLLLGQRPLMPFQGVWQNSIGVCNPQGAASQPMPRLPPPVPQFRSEPIAQGPAVVGGNVSTRGPVDVHCKAIQQVEFERKDLVVHPVYIRPGTYPTKDFVNNVAKECIETLAESNEYVSPDRIQKLLCQRMNLYSINQVGCQHLDQIPCVRELNMLVSKVNAYIMAFVKTRAICTLHELNESLRDYVPNKGDFTNLKLGPLQRLPEVYKYFSFPPNQAEIPEITSMDVLDHFHNFLTRNKLWQADLTRQLEPFMNYLVEQYSADNAYILGVIIRSVKLATMVLKKAQRDTGQSHREVYDHFKNNLKLNIEDAFRKFRVSILQLGNDNEMEVRRHYLKMRPELVIMEVFEKLCLLMTVTQVEERKFRATKIGKCIKDFLTVMRNDDVAKPLLHLAICMSNTTLEEMATEMLLPSQDRSGGEEMPGSSTVMTQAKPPPRKDALVEALKKFIEICLNAGALRLTDLDRIEARLVEDFDYPTFQAMGYGRFLAFVTTEAKQLLEEGGGLVLGSSSAGAKGETSLRVQQAEIVKFVKQCKQSGRTEPSEIEEALCSQYSIGEVRHLGCGSISRLITLSEKQDRHHNGEFYVHYESALLPKKGQILKTPAKVGILGSQTKEAAKFCLHNCPLLEDLAEWSQWGLVFEPELGKLRDFVQNYGGVITKQLEGGKIATLDFYALEVRPGKLLKIVSTTSPDHIAKALENRDVVSFCGHLVSMVVAYKGVDKLPMALLVGHMKTALLQLHAGETQTYVPGAPTTAGLQHAAALFVLRCLLQVPTKICAALADELFLVPLSQVVGAAVSKQVLIQLCTTNTELNQLIELGCLLGIHEWRDFIQQKCKLPDSAIQTVSAEEEELLVTDNQDEAEEEEEESSSDEEEDLEDILAGNTSLTVVDEVGSEDKTEEQSELEDDEKDTTEDDEEGTTEEDEESADAAAVSESAMDEETEDSAPTTCEGIVNLIRKEEFGVGIQLSEDGQKLMKVQQERLGRSLDRLSKDLYSKDTHFVLELVQNADDNSYHPDLLSASATDDCPSVKFTIDMDTILVQNNEQGFEEKNIRALCDVGRSTKGKHKFGYIGQKGIGFKSVFRVTDMPEVHSNGFHIKFDVNSGPMGYILPHWVPTTEDEQNPEQWMTSILLRLKPDMQHQYRTLAARFNDIHPSLLLFLHRLRQITIENKVEDSVLRMRRRDIGDSIIEIEHTHVIERFLVTRKILDASKISLQAKSGADVESTEIALAFPLRPKGQTQSSLQTMPPKQPVFAFLPLRSYGFRFIIQGDFDVPSSREDVDRDSSWNQWLRNEIHTLFLDALEVFKNHSDFTSMEAVCSFLQFVPMEDEVLDFFKPVALDILKKLKAKPCVPTQPNSQGVISWKIPSQTVRVRDPLVRSVITPELLQEHLNLYYLHSDVAAMLNSTLTSCLGIETLTSEHLFQLGRATILKMNSVCINENVVLVSRWLACMYRSLDEFQHDDSILGKLESLAALPLSTGEMVAAAEKTVFFPVSSSESKKQKGKDLLFCLQQDLNCVHPLLLDTGDKEVDSQVQKLLGRLGVKQLTPFDVVNHHILPVLKSDTWKSKSVDTLVAYLAYIREHTDVEPSVCNLEELREVARVCTNKGLKCPNQEPIHFPTQYGNPINLQDKFSGYDWTLLDPRYIPQHCTQGTITSCHNFFSKLGVEDCLSVRRREVRLTREELAQSPWSEVCEIWPKNEAEYNIDDYHCEELEGLIKYNKHPTGPMFENQMRHLCIYLDRNWDGKFSRCTVTQVRDKSKKHLKDTDTSFSILLRRSGWLPALDTKSVADFDGTVMLERSVVIKEPYCLYVRSEQVESLLSQKVLYLDVNLAMGPFLQFLGLKNSVTIETVKSSLMQWSTRKEPDTAEAFCTSLEHMKNIYTYLSKELPMKEFQDLLRDQPVYFVPTQRVPEKVEVVGKMLNRKEIWLADKTGLFVKYSKILEEYHSEISGKRIIAGHYSSEILELFRQVGNVDPQPAVEEYIELLNLLCTTSSPKDVKVFSDVLFIFSTLGLAISTLPEGLQDQKTAEMALEGRQAMVKKKIGNLKVFPTKKQAWVSLEERPMIADNKEWEKWFSNKEGVHFLSLEDRLKSAQPDRAYQPGYRGRRFQPGRGRESQQQAEMVEMFIEFCEVKKLSKCVTTEPTPGMIEPCFALQNFFHVMAPVIQKYLMTQFQDVYGDLTDRKTKEMLADAKFYQTSNLEVTYRISGLKLDTFEVRSEKCALVPPTFYFHRDHLSSVSEIIHELARYFSSGNAACNTALRSFLTELSNIIQANSWDTVEQLLSRHEADNVEVPPDECWQVEAPYIPEPEPEPEPKPEPESQGFVPFSQSGQQSESTKQEPFELRAWPPVRNENRPSQQRERVEKAASNIWPPPQGKDYMRSVRDLPSNIKVTPATVQTQSSGQPADQSTENRGQHSDGISKGNLSPRELKPQISVESNRSESNRSEGKGSKGSIQRSEGQVKLEVPMNEDGVEHRHRQPGTAGVAGQHQTDGGEPRGAPGTDSDFGRKRKLSGTDTDEQRSKRHSAGDQLVEVNEEAQDNNKVQEVYTSPPPVGRQMTPGRPEDYTPGNRQKEPHIKGSPIWSDMVTEYTYDELASSSDLPLPGDLELAEGAGDSEVGYWGEALVAEYLQVQEKAGHILKFSWMNKSSETGCPYDFEVHFADETGMHVDYIEVKSTITSSKQVFEISVQQVKFAADNPGNFHIYRVFNAGDPGQVRLIRIHDLDSRLSQKQVKLCMVI